MRTTTGAIDTALAGSNVPMVVFVEMDFPSGFLRINNSAQSFDWNGYSWLGIGSLGSIDQITESSDMAANGIALSISGIPSENVALALGQKYQGRSCKVWFALLDSSYQVIADPIGSFNYRMDTMDIELGETATIRVSAESRLVDWERANVTRYTDEEQQKLYPGDLGLQFVPQMAEKELRWGY